MRRLNTKRIIEIRNLKIIYQRPKMEREREREIACVSTGNGIFEKIATTEELRHDTWNTLLS